MPIANMEDRKAYYREYNRNRRTLRFGMTIEEYDRKFEEQKGLCAICSQPETAVSNYMDGETRLVKGLAIDHDHACCPTSSSCGKCVRGLICQNCNIGLGVFRDDPQLLTKAVEYLNQERDYGVSNPAQGALDLALDDLDRGRVRPNDIPS